MTLKAMGALVLPSLSAGCIGCPSSQYALARDLERPPPLVCEPEEDEERCRIRHVGPMRLGWLSLGLTVDAVIARLGPPDAITDRVTDDGGGSSRQELAWSEDGVFVAAAGPTGTRLVVERFVVMPPFVERTDRGVGLGSHESEVRAAYGAVADTRLTTLRTRLVAGGRSTAITFEFAGGEVVRISIGEVVE